MKRECRQHGMVRTYRILPSPFPRPESRFVNKFDSPPTAGFFTKVQSKPTNHSKFTGKCDRSRCSGCHLHPSCKSKDKGKGTQKLKSCDVAANCKLITWRAVDRRPGLSFGGASASGILDFLSSQEYLYDDCEEEEEEQEQEDKEIGGDAFEGLIESSSSPLFRCLEEKKIESTVVDDIKEEDDDDDDDDDDMGFFEVGFVCDDQIDGDGGWCLVGEM